MSAALAFFGKKDQISDPRLRFEAGKLGVWVFLASLSTLFGATIIGFVVIRVQTEDWPASLPALPGIMWLATLVLMLSSGTIQLALLRVREDRADGFKSMILLTTILGFVFLGLQTVSWWAWFDRMDETLVADSEFYRFAIAGFYVLTGVHALHVLGGLLPMSLVTRRAFGDRYSSKHYPGVQYCVMYWHFLDAVWLVLFVVLLIGV